MDVEKWHRKNNQLDGIKKKFKHHMGKYNMLKCEYADWFKKQNSSFLAIIKSVQVSMPTLVPQKVQTMKHFRVIMDMANRMMKSGHGVGTIGGAGRMEQFIEYWDRYCILHEQLQDLVRELNSFVYSIAALRQQSVKDEIDNHYDDLCRRCSETYPFGDLNNERDNLYTYGLMLPDQGFLGLLGFLPYLMTVATKLCFLTTRVHLEKE